MFNTMQIAIYMNTYVYIKNISGGLKTTNWELANAWREYIMLLYLYYTKYTVHPYLRVHLYWV